jgi:2-C-methyl-D-erythritol 4-phosphate cytidylyltransferase
VLDPACEFVAVHDAARPCVTPELIDAVFAAARAHGAALPGLPVADTLKRLDGDGLAIETVPRAGLVAVQTPQAFRRDLLVRAYANRGRLSGAVTDDAQLVEALGHPCRVVEGSPLNLKITTRTDLRLAAAVLQVLPQAKREGPAHPFADEQAMWGHVPMPRDRF